jgi:muramoyltetrapeptide carboxypeptidase
MTSRPLALPPPVGPGDRVGVAALSGPVDPARLERGLAALARLGFEPVPADNLTECDSTGMFAGDDDRRLAAFHRLAADPGLGAIVFARGGWGALRVLPRIDWELLARHPRAYVGYSDLTPFLLEVNRRLGLVAFHGPMVAADLARGLEPAEEASFLGALGGRYPAEVAVELAPEERDAPPVEGPLVGGCLSLLASLEGTPYAADTAGALLFVEDVDEPLYRLDRLLTHLRLSGRLARIRALLFGHLDGRDGAPALEALRRGLDPVDWPIAWNLPVGHRAPNLTLPVGLLSRLEPAAGSLVLGGGERR